MLRLYHIIAILIYEHKEICRTALDLEIVDTHGYVLFPDLFRCYKGAVALYFLESIEIAVFTVPGDKRYLLVRRQCPVL